MEEAKPNGSKEEHKLHVKKIVSIFNSERNFY